MFSASINNASIEITCYKMANDESQYFTEEAFDKINELLESLLNNLTIELNSEDNDVFDSKMINLKFSMVKTIITSINTNADFNVEVLDEDLTIHSATKIHLPKGVNLNMTIIEKVDVSTDRDMLMKIIADKHIADYDYLQ